MIIYCRLLLRKLEIPGEYWSEYLEEAESISIDIDSTIKSLVFLGMPVTPKEGMTVSIEALRDLQILGVTPKAQAYRHGLFSLKTNDGSLIDLIAFETDRKNSIANLEESEKLWLETLTLGAKLLQLLLQEHLYLNNQMINLEMLIKEQDQNYQEIGCYCLPPSFLSRLKDPTSFLNYTAPQIGRLYFLKE